MGYTEIEWTDRVWNPVTGCTKVSQGCKNCYAERVFPRAYGRQEVIMDGASIHSIPVTALERYRTDKLTRNRKFTDVQCHPERLDQPLRWKRPQRIFVNSMSDLFHEAIPLEFIDQVFAVMALAPQHTFQILTKRPQRMESYMRGLYYFLRGRGSDADRSKRESLNYPHGALKRMQECFPPPNVHLGVSCEDQATFLERSAILAQTLAAVRFLSLEPLLEGIDCGNALDDPPDDSPYGKIHWVIIGGESGPGARPFDIQWARDILAQCNAAGVPCFVKQLGAQPIAPNSPCPIDCQCGLHRGFQNKKGGDWNEWPEDLRVRDFPGVTEAGLRSPVPGRAVAASDG